jgi:hypothetical protein
LIFSHVNSKSYGELHTFLWLFLPLIWLSHYHRLTSKCLFRYSSRFILILGRWTRPHTQIFLNRSSFVGNWTWFIFRKKSDNLNKIFKWNLVRHIFDFNLRKRNIFGNSKIISKLKFFIRSNFNIFPSLVCHVIS